MGDLVTRMGDKEIPSVSGRLPNNLRALISLIGRARVGPQPSDLLAPVWGKKEVKLCTRNESVN